MSCVHQFGIIEDYKEVEQYLLKNSYIEYAPEKYNCIAVEDDIMLDICDKLIIQTSLGSNYNKPYIGLAYTGITIIPPTSVQEFIDILLKCKYRKDKQIIDLIDLLKEAYERNKYILHYGI